MSYQFTRDRIRLIIDVSRTTPLSDARAGILDSYRGTDMQFEFAVFDADNLMPVDGYATVKLEVKDGKFGAVVMTKTLSAAELNNALTQDQWEAGHFDPVFSGAGATQHGIFVFTHSESNLDLGGKDDKTFYIVVSATTPDTPDHWITLATGSFKLIEDGTPSDVPPYVAPLENQVPSGAVYSAGGDPGGAKYLVTVRDEQVLNFTKGALDTGYKLANQLNSPGPTTTDGRITAKTYKVKAASTGADTFPDGVTGEQVASLDGVTLGIGDIFLLKDCTNNAENGVYRITDGLGNFVRHLTTDDYFTGQVFVPLQGTQAGTSWQFLYNDSVPTLIQFIQIATGYTNIILFGSVSGNVNSVLIPVTSFSADEADERFQLKWDTVNIEADIATAQAAADAAQGTADTAVTNAATAQTAADSAQSTANTAVTNAATAQAAADSANVNANSRVLNTPSGIVDAIYPAVLKDGDSVKWSRSGDPTEPRVTIAAVGDLGQYGVTQEQADALAVATLIKGQAPSDVLALGDLNYPSGALNKWDDNVGRNWRSFIYPFVGDTGVCVLLPGEVDATTNHFWPVPGNHDWGDVVPNPTGLDSYKAYFALPGNERYYSQTFAGGVLDIFFIDSDGNEPDGNTVGSTQYNAFAAWAAASTAKFKGVCVHHPARSSGSSHPETAALQWDFAAKGVNFVLQGHNHNYERINYTDGVRYFTVGTGGRTRNGFNATPEVGSASRLNTAGALFLEVNSASVRFVFRDTTGAALDTDEIFSEETDSLTPYVEYPDNLPTPITIGSAGSTGDAPEVARADHDHPAPPLASPTVDGFMSKEYADLLERLSATTGIGFDAPVRALMVDGDKIYAGGDFTKYGTLNTPRLARLSSGGRLDIGFNVGSGFTESIKFITKASDGDIVVGSSAKNTYRGTAGGMVWKLNLDGTNDATFTCPDPISMVDSADDVLTSLCATTGGKIVMLTPLTFRFTDLNGASSITRLGTSHFNFVLPLSGNKVLLSSTAYSDSGFTTAQTFDGTGNPKGLKLINLDANPDCSCAAGSPDPDWAAAAGVGSEADCYSVALGKSYHNGTYAIVGNVNPKSGTDWSWDGGNQVLFKGILKVMANGDAPVVSEELFDISLGLTAGEGPAIIFGVDSQGRIYFGGPVTSINGSTTDQNGGPIVPWRIYRVTKTGAFDHQFGGFNDKVLCCVLKGDDKIIAGGLFTQYNDKKVGYVTLMDSSGASAETDSAGFSLADEEGLVIYLDTAPDVLANPKYGKYIWVLPQDPPIAYVWNKVQQIWQPIAGTSAGGTDNNGGNPSDNQLPYPDIMPASGTQIPDSGTLEITMRVVGHSLDIEGGNCVIYYTTDGTNPADPTSGTRVQYTGPFTISSKTSIKAYAIQPSWLDSQISTATYDTAESGSEAVGQWLLNFNMAATTPKIGPAATGWDLVNYDDFWNPVLATQTGQVQAVRDADGNLMQVKLLIPRSGFNQVIMWNNFQTTAPDLMLKGGIGANAGSYFTPATDFNIDSPVFQFLYLPSGVYDVYVYHHGQEDEFHGDASIITNEGIETPRKTTVDGTWATRPWTEGVQYSKFTVDIADPTDAAWLGVKTYTVDWDNAPFIQRSSIVNGIQIRKLKKLPYVRFNQLDGTPSPTTLTAFCYGASGQGSVIHYESTTDGSTPPDPTAASPIYSGAITVPVATKFKFIAIKTGWTDSDISAINFV